MVFQQKEIRKIDICYLCGRKLSDDCTDDDDDHVPPKQFFAKSIRKIHNPNLLTLPTHKTCNSCYKLDEDYFADSLAPVVSKSYSGKALWDNVLNRYIEEPRRRKLGERIHKEFNRRPGGIVLPAGKIVKTLRFLKY